MERDFFVEISVFWGFFGLGWLVGFYFTWSGACLLYFMSEAVLMQGDNNSTDFSGVFERREMAKLLFTGRKYDTC